jgi:hypothetical protein
VPACSSFWIRGRTGNGNLGVVAEHVVDVDLGVIWEPNVPLASLVTNDAGEARLALQPHFDDPDQRPVALLPSQFFGHGVVVQSDAIALKIAALPHDEAFTLQHTPCRLAGFHVEVGNVVPASQRLEFVIQS